MKTLAVIVMLLLSLNANAALVTYNWEQTSCIGPALTVCDTTIEGSWVFEQSAVDAGVAVFSTHPYFGESTVKSFNFTIGAFTYNTINFGSRTWTNTESLSGAQYLGLFGKYEVMFSSDRSTVIGLSQNGLPGDFFNNPVLVGFELSPMNPTISLRVEPTSIRFINATGDNPIVDDMYVDPDVTMHGQWVRAPIPVPAAAWLFGSGLIGLVGVARRKKA